MISDIIFEAIENINKFRSENPAFYEDAEIQTEIDDVLFKMDALRSKLDSPDGADGLLKLINPCKHCGRMPSVFNSTAYNRLEISCAAYDCEDDKKTVNEQDHRKAIEKWNAENPKS